MKLWLSRQRDGKYMLSREEPLWVRVGDTTVWDFYMKPGDPIGYRAICSFGAMGIFGIELAIGDAVQVTLEGKVLP